VSTLLGPGLALLSSLLWGSADFLGGLLSRRRAAAAVVGASQTAGLLAVLLVAAATGAVGGPLGWLPWAVAAGLSGTLGLLCFYRALSIGTMGIVSPIAALGAVVPVLIGVATGERPAVLQLVGIAVALAGAAAASGPELRGSAGPAPVVLAAVAGVGFGLALVFIARGSQTSTLMTLVGMRGTSVTLFLLAALALRTLGGLRPRDVAPVALVGLGDVAANLAFAVATTMGLLSVSAVLGSLYPVATVLLARGVLKERLLAVQQAGVVTALAGVVLITVG
jgi:drug/metabolite transporter (DMT)-like permease